MMIIEPPSTRTFPAFAAFVLLSTLTTLASAQVASSPAKQWILSWSDEFSGPAGSPPDPAKWAFEQNGDNYNNELETYTGLAANVQQKNGNLAITALKEDTARPDGTTRHYTSGRIITKDLFSQTYGRFEARIKLPLGKGIWPAFWLLGSDIDRVGWPTCGEVDIFENIGEATISYSTLHGPGYSGAKGISANYALPADDAVNTSFHLYSVEWRPNDIKFFFDDHLVAERTPDNLPPNTKWVYDHPFFIILNLAVGGDWPGKPDQTTTLPQQMLVDYVRVYKQADRGAKKKGQSAGAAVQSR